MENTINQIKMRYKKDDNIPWYLGFSGGKDSTALLAMVYAALLKVKKPKKPVTLLYCDTGVEIPIIVEYVRKALQRIQRQANSDGLPIKTKILHPRLQDSFFVNVIGSGYPPPTNKFRWCTDRLRVGPVRRAMQSLDNTLSLMLLGTRWEESKERSRTLTRFSLDGEYYFKQAGNANVTIYAPIAHFSTKKVWLCLHSNNIPTCLNIPELVSLYQSASGSSCSGLCGDCDKCTSGRFGCWVCTVVRKDRAVTNMVSNGHPELAPLLDFRNWLMSIRDNLKLRYKTRRNGQVGPGSFNMRTRRRIISRLKKTEDSTDWSLISEKEERAIEKLWCKDVRG